MYFVCSHPFQDDYDLANASSSSSSSASSSSSSSMDYPDGQDPALLSSSARTDGEEKDGGQNWTYGIIYTYYYTVWSNLIVTTIIPLTVLIFCNVGIFLTLRRSRQSIIRAARVGAHSQFSSTRQRNENGLALLLIAIVMVFLVCHACRFFLAFYRVSAI